MRVMCADDEVLLLEELEKTVREVLPQAEMDSFNKASEAMAYASEGFVDIAFLDINMGTVDGVSIARKLQEVNPKVNIVFCTGYTEYALDALGINCSGYLMKPITTEKVQKAVDTLRHPLDEIEGDKQKLVEIQCFGNFDVKMEGVSVKFKYRKSRELLAYLVDRKGSLCTRGEMSAALFEDDGHEEYLTKLRRDLLDTFAGLGVTDVLNIQKGQLGINKNLIKCDYFDYLENKPGAREAFKGEYMAQYSFAEDTLGVLLKYF